MRLTEEERRRIDELEAMLCAEDPRLARRFERARRLPLVGLVFAASPPTRGLLGFALVVVGAVLAIAMLTVSLPVSIAGAVLMALGGYATLTSGVVSERLRRFEAWLSRGSHRADRET